MGVPTDENTDTPLALGVEPAFAIASPATTVTFLSNSITVTAENVLALCVMSSFSTTSSGTSLGSLPSATRP